ncbi:MAG: hypothetical protein AABX53_03350 [Nanoarchaeota archaeon]
MDVLFPISAIDFVRWETRLSELEELVQKTRESKVLWMMDAGSMPKEMLDVQIKEIIYLAGEVCALTRFDYLNSMYEDQTILNISQTTELCKFCPVNPTYFRTIKNR